MLFQVSCPIRGFLSRRLHEDGELNDAILEAFDSADFGVLHDVDLAGFTDFWEIIGFYSFEVEAESEQEALALAPSVFNDLWDKDEVDCGDLIDTERREFPDGEKEEFRCCGKREGGDA